MFLLSEAERKYREKKFFLFKSNYEYYDLTPSAKQLQAFERYVAGEIDGHQIQKVFHQLNSGKDEGFTAKPMDDWY